MLRRRGLRTSLLAVAALSAIAVVALAQASGLLGYLELDSVDARFRLRGPEPTRELVIVAIDDRTFGDLGERWPFPRSLHGRAIDAIAAARPAAIVYDVQFTEQTEEKEDNALIDAVAEAGRTVLATTETDENGGSLIFGGDEVLRDIGARPGNANFLRDEDGVIRRMPLVVEGMKSLGVAGAEVARRGRVARPGGGTETPLIDFRGPAGTIESVSFSQLVEGEVPASKLRGRTVLVGPTAPSLQDVHATSTTRDGPMAGVELQANALWTAAHGFPLRAAPGWAGWLAIVMLGAVGPLAALRLSRRRALLVLAATGILVAGGGIWLFGQGIVVQIVAPLLALAAGAVAALVVNELTAAVDRERTRALFSRFVPESVVDEVLARTDDDVRLGGVEREGTVLFSDLRGFTAFAEALPVDAVVRVLNRYLTEMSDGILDQGGTLVSYMGDGIMAVFGAPIEQDDHADRALAAARDMLGPRLARFNAWLREEGLGVGFRMGVGINSGSVMSGNVGSARRLEYTAIGDTTNTAARLEAMTKDSPHQLYVAAATRTMLRRPAPDLLELGPLDVRGRQGTVDVWTLPEAAVEPVVAAS